jgi:ferredoxin
MLRPAAHRASACGEATAIAILRVDAIACGGHGICAELLPELVSLDDWGYPIINEMAIPAALVPLARRAVALCPTLALSLSNSASSRRSGTRHTDP